MKNDAGAGDRAENILLFTPTKIPFLSIPQQKSPSGRHFTLRGYSSWKPSPDIFISPFLEIRDLFFQGPEGPFRVPAFAGMTGMKSYQPSAISGQPELSSPVVK